MTKPSKHQLYMLAMFAKGWRFNPFNKKPGSWNTYWALRRKGLCNHRGAEDVLTEKGRMALERRGNGNV